MENRHNDNRQTNVYEMVTKRILQRMMQGEIPWRNAWTAGKGQKHPFTNRFTGKPYSFLNTLLLGTPGQYATFRQIKEKGGTVKKGSKSKPVIYWGEYIPKDRKEEAKQLEEEGKDTSHLKVRFPKYYSVFDMRDVEGIEPEKEPEAVTHTSLSPTDIADMAVEDYTRDYGVLVDEADAEPSYDAAADRVTVPPKKAYEYEEDWYASLFGQLVHSTAGEKRCNRAREMEKMADDEMSVKEELIAEIGSSMAMTVTGLDRKETQEQQAAVCQKWIAAMENDYRLIVTASYGAEKAAKMILGEFAE